MLRIIIILIFIVSSVSLKAQDSVQQMRKWKKPKEGGGKKELVYEVFYNQKGNIIEEEIFEESIRDIYVYNSANLVSRYTRKVQDNLFQEIEYKYDSLNNPIVEFFWNRYEGKYKIVREYRQHLKVKETRYELDTLNNELFTEYTKYKYNAHGILKNSIAYGASEDIKVLIQYNDQGKQIFSLVYDDMGNIVLKTEAEYAPSNLLRQSTRREGNKISKISMIYDSLNLEVKAYYSTNLCDNDLLIHRKTYNQNWIIKEDMTFHYSNGRPDKKVLYEYYKSGKIKQKEIYDFNSEESVPGNDSVDITPSKTTCNYREDGKISLQSNGQETIHYHYNTKGLLIKETISLLGKVETVFEYTYQY